MARNDGIDRTLARNRDLSANDIMNAQAHNEREKEIYSNPDPSLVGKVKEKIMQVSRSTYVDLRGKFDRLQQSYNRECARTSQMGERINSLVAENKTLKHLASDLGRIKKVLGQETIDAALEASRQEDLRRKAPKKKQKEYSR